jgi:hypothetical protein
MNQNPAPFAPFGAPLGLASTPCVQCGTPVTVYPPEDGEDCRAACGRCAHSPTAVVEHAVTARLGERKAAAVARKQARRIQRAQLAARRNAGLVKRHAAKLARSERDEQPAATHGEETSTPRASSQASRSRMRGR